MFCLEEGGGGRKKETPCNWNRSIRRIEAKYSFHHHQKKKKKTLPNPSWRMPNPNVYMKWKTERQESWPALPLSRARLHRCLTLVANSALIIATCETSTKGYCGTKRETRCYFVRSAHAVVNLISCWRLAIWTSVCMESQANDVQKFPGLCTERIPVWAETCKCGKFCGWVFQGSCGFARAIRKKLRRIFFKVCFWSFPDWVTDR